MTTPDQDSSLDVPRGGMTADQMVEWIDSHPPLPREPWTHTFMEPCGSSEGTNSCWFCGAPKADHPEKIDAD